MLSGPESAGIGQMAHFAAQAVEESNITLYLPPEALPEALSSSRRDAHVLEDPW